MGIFDKLFGGSKSEPNSRSGNECPACGASAVISGGQVRCTNPSCKFYSGAGAQSKQPTRQYSGNFTPKSPITIRYRNFRNEEKSFVSDAATIERKNNRLSVQVAPSGERISLSRSRILNLQEVESSFHQKIAEGQSWPTPRERQVLNYHKKHGTTSALYEQIRAKYPNW